MAWSLKCSSLGLFFCLFLAAPLKMTLIGFRAADLKTKTSPHNNEEKNKELKLSDRECQESVHVATDVPVPQEDDITVHNTPPDESRQ